MRIKLAKECEKLIKMLVKAIDTTHYDGKIPCEAATQPNTASIDIRNMVGTISSISQDDMSIIVSTNRRFDVAFTNKQIMAVPRFRHTEYGLKLEKFDIVSYDDKEAV